MLLIVSGTIEEISRLKSVVRVVSKLQRTRRKALIDVSVCSRGKTDFVAGSTGHTEACPTLSCHHPHLYLGTRTIPAANETVS